MTSDGLSVYDGFRFVNYTVTDGLPHRMINDIVEIGPDSFLLATNTEKINTLVKGRIGELTSADTRPPLINTFLKSPDKVLYALGDYGFYRLNGDRFDKIPLTDSYGTPVDSNLHAALEAGHYILLSTWSSLNPQRLILVDKRTMKMADLIEDAHISMARNPKTGVIWVATTHSIFYLDSISLNRGKLLLMPGAAGYPANAYPDAAFHFDNTGNLWLYNRHELLRLDMAKRANPERIFKTGQPFQIASLFSDREGTLWVLSRGSGVYKICTSRLQMIQENHQGNPILATALSPGPRHHGIAFADRSSGNLYIRTTETQLSVPVNYPTEINDLFVQDERIVISGTHTILSIPRKGHTYVSLRAKKLFEDSLVRFLHGKADPFGNIIIPYYKNGKYYLSVISGNSVYMNQSTQAESESDMIDRISFDTGNRLWMINRNNELLGYVLDAQNPRNYFKMTGRHREKRYPGGYRSLTIDRKNHFWIGTRDSGIYMLGYQGRDLETILHLDKSEGLTDNFVTDIATDGQYGIWVSSTSGLDLIRMADSPLSVENVTANNRIFQEIHSVVADLSGGAWGLCTNGALVRASGEQETGLTGEPELYISNVRAGKKIIDMPAGHLSFTHTENNIQFLLAAPSYIDEGSIRFSYLLEGSGQKTWSDGSTIPQLNFLNLPAGNYTLKVRAIFPAKKYAAKTAEITFRISPAYWQTLWFQTLAGLLCAAMLLAIFRTYYKQRLVRDRLALEKKQAIEKERTRIATDMHDDLGSWLSRIKYLSESMLLHKQPDASTRKNLEKISQFSDEMVEKMGEIVWALNEKNDTLADLLAFSRSYAVDYLTSNNIACEFTVPEEVPYLFVKGELRRNVFLSLKEILYNVVKHAGATKVSIAVGLSPELSIEISDNGRGIDFAHIRKYSNGLSNIRQRINQSGGTVHFENRNGTLVSLSVPLDA